MTLINQLKAYLKALDGWTPSGEIERKVWFHKNGKTHKPSSVSRRLRELAEEGVLETRMEGKSVEYKYRLASEPPKQITMIRHPRTGELMSTEAYALL